MFLSPVLIQNLVGTGQVVVNNAELQRATRCYMPHEPEGGQITKRLELFSPSLRSFYNLLVSKVMPSKFSLASSLCGRKLNVSFSDSFITHSSADVLQKAYWEFFSILFILLSSLLPWMLVTQGKTKHLNATNTVITRSLEMLGEQTKPMKSPTYSLVFLTYILVFGHLKYKQGQSNSLSRLGLAIEIHLVPIEIT